MEASARIWKFGRSLAASVLVGVLFIVGFSTAAEAAVVNRAGTQGASSSTIAAAAVPADPAFISPLRTYNVAGYFGARCPGSIGAGTWHDGLDLSTGDGSPIYSVAAGTVTEVVEPSSDSVAGRVTVDHGEYQGARLITNYAHMWAPSKFVKVGSKVAKGQKIAEVGASGVASGPHLHLTVTLGGKSVDPLPFFSSKGLDLLAGATKAAVKTVVPAICKGMITHGRLAVRTSPDIKSAIVTILSPQTIYSVKSGPATNGFAEVTIPDGRKGWAMTQSIGSMLRSPLMTEADLQLGSTGNAGTKYRLSTGVQYVRHLPVLAQGAREVLYLASTSDVLTATGRKLSGSNWIEVTVSAGNIAVTGWLYADSRLIKVQ